MSVGRALAALFALAFASEAFAQTYTWIGASNAGWGTKTDWSPNTTGSTGPQGSAVTVLDGYTSTASTSSTIPAGSANIGTIDSGTSSWNLFGPSSVNITTTFATVNQGGNATLGSGGITFRDTPNGAGGQQTLNITTINVTSGTLSLGSGLATTAGQELDALGEAPNVNLEGTAGTAQLGLNVLGGVTPAVGFTAGGYTLGVVDATGTGTNNLVLIANSDTTVGGYTQTATVAALEGTGTLNVYGAGGTEGGTATLNIVNSTATAYASAAVLADKSGTPATGQLALTVNLSGGATQTLTGASTYSGGTTVSSIGTGGGTLYVSNTTSGGSGLGIGPVTVASGATLGGTGTIAPSASNNVTINGVLEPGDLGQTASNAFTPGTLTFNLTGGSQLILGGGSALNLTLGNASTSVNFTTAGNWLSGNGTLTLNLTSGAGFLYNTAYSVFTNVITTGFAPSTVTLNGTTLSSSAYTFALSGTNYVVTLVGQNPGDEVITGPPAAVNLATGQTATFTVTANGSGTLTYQWYFNGTALADGANITGVTTSMLMLTDVQPSQVGSYTVMISDPSGSVTSTAVGLAGAGTATFSVQPVSATLAAGQTASFYAPATGTGTVSYQWYLNGTAVASSTDAYLLVTPVSSTNAGSYTCIATDSTGSTLSEAAVLTLSASTDLGRLTNVSVRTNCGTGSANIITGFVIGGSGTDGSSKELLIRADGPELANFGVPGFLPDPSLDVFNTAGSSPVSVGQNTGWCVTQTNENQVIAAGSAVYAFPLTTNSASSAVVLTLPSDSYTENVTGASNDTGIALAEVYDVSNATETYSPTIPRLVNVSARANVAPGAGNLIAGFTIGGTTDKTVLVRGTGPGLSEFGLTGLLDQPTLAVYSTSSGDTLVGTNTGWGEDPVLAAAAASVYAFTQTSSADCALLVTLPPGTYTANLNSNDGTSGLALVEVYEVP